MNKGKVYLVGAGPGDVDLLTVKAVELIESADVVVYDRLVSRPIRDLIPGRAKRIDVGKNVGNHPVPQSQINQILKEEAEKGNMVVRLKGGDPFVFGRGGEELEILLENEIEFEVVPGIPSPISVPAYAGIPVTHRDFCSSFHVITGHAKEGSDLKIDFDSLVKLNGTLIFMMSVSTVGRIMQGLMQAGMSKEMPCAVIENGTRTNQRKFVSSISKMEQVILENQVKSPAVIVVGKVCQLSFDWFSAKPLKGQQIIVTLPEKKQSALAQMLHRLGADVLTYPCIETKAIPNFELRLDGYHVIIFTSAAGVEIFFETMMQSGMDARCLYDKKIACVGEKTAKKLREYGINCDFVPSVYDGETLANEMVQQKFMTPQDKVLLLRAKNASKQLTEILKKNKIEYCDQPIYSTDYVKQEEIDLKEYDYIMFTSGSCVDGFIHNNPNADATKMKAVCIGKCTAKKAQDAGFCVLVSEKATLESMCDRIRSDLKC